ncbi:MAG: transporter substrate-binding domain-containing protein [Deltaproteobacteria bacterium]|nr:transporter substrate-binding domain-containing protein [Deltaproteobacteria bacterium]
MSEPDARVPETLVISCDREFPPYTTANAENEPAGMLVDLWRLWSDKTGHKITFRVSDWEGTLSNLRQGLVDVHMGLFRNEERETWIDFSMPIYASGSALFYPLNQGTVLDLSGLKGLKVGVVRGGDAENFLAVHKPDLVLVRYDEPKTMVRAALSGGIRAFADESLGMLTLLEPEGWKDQIGKPAEEFYTKDMCAGVRKGRKELLELVNRGLNAISKEEMAEIERRWIADPGVRRFGP